MEENMKKITFIVIICLMGVSLSFAQENQPENSIHVNVYTFFVNVVNEQFRFPLIGFVNIAGGSHSLPQIGFFNWNQNNFGSLQLSFINTVGGTMTGVQMGFVNTTVKSLKGVQVGFINTAIRENGHGLQLGFVNTTVKNFDGAQISFINASKKINGFQIGFINYAESIESGIPLGFISIVRNGGYKAIELSVTELSPLNMAFKIGVDKFYTSINFSYNPMKTEIRDGIFLGLGLGSIITINKKFFFNPELVSTHGINEINQNYLGLIPSFGYRIISGLSVLVGPSITWSYTFDDKEFAEPFFSIFNHKINENHNLIVGGKIALRFQW
jgi:hypothetical protein